LEEKVENRKIKRRNMYMLNENDVVPFAWRGLADWGQGEVGVARYEDGYHR
jgi:hypothetical protein